MALKITPTLRRMAKDPDFRDAVCQLIAAQDRLRDMAFERRGTARKPWDDKPSLVKQNRAV